MTYHRINLNPELDKYCALLNMSDTQLAKALRLSRQTLYDWRRSGTLTDRAISKIETLHDLQQVRLLDKTIASFPESHRSLLALTLEIVVGRIKNACADYTAEQLSKGLLNILPNY